MNLSLGDIFKFLEVSFGQAVVLLIACIGVDYAIANDMLPLGKYAEVAISITRVLIIFSAANLIWKSVDWVVQRQKREARKKKRRETILNAFELLGDIELEIVLACVALNEQTFVKPMDDAVAKSLCSRSLVKKPHGWVDMFEAPFMFYDDAWILAKAHFINDVRIKEIRALLPNT